MRSEGVGVWELPEGRHSKSLGEIIEISYGKGLPERKRDQQGVFPVYGSNGPVGLHSVGLTKGVTIIIGRKGSIGAVHISDGPCWPIDTTYYVDDFPSGLLPKYLFLFLKSLDLTQLDRSAAIPGIRREDLYYVQIPVPPLDKQRRIVVGIEELFTRIEEARRLRAAADNDVDSLLDAAMTEVFSEKALGHWEKVPLEHFASIQAKQVDPTLPDYRNLPHINGNVIESGNCRLLPYNTAAEDGMISGKYLFTPGNVLYSKIRPYLRKATTVDFAGLCSADMYPLTVADRRLVPRFLMWSLVAPPFTTYAIDRSGRARMPKLNRSQLFAYSFPLPPTSEQHRIVEYLDGIQTQVAELKRVQAESAAELERLEGAILARAFRGEL